MEALLNKIHQLNSININEILIGVFSSASFRKEILDKIRIDQLFKEGVTEENKVLGYYSPATEAINPYKKAGTHYTMRDTGAFFESFRLFVYENYILISANPIKDDVNLFEVYKDYGNMLGLTEENFEWLINRVKTLMNEQIRKELL